MNDQIDLTTDRAEQMAYSWVECKLVAEPENSLRYFVVSSSDNVSEDLGLPGKMAHGFFLDDHFSGLFGYSGLQIKERLLASQGGFRFGFQSPQSGRWYHVYVYLTSPDEVTFLFSRASGLASASFRAGFPGDVLEHNPLAVQIIDQEGKTRYVNHAFKQLLSLDCELYRSFFDDPQLKAQGFETIFDELKLGKRLVSGVFSYEISHPDFLNASDILYLEATLFPLDVLEEMGGGCVVFYIDKTQIYLEKLQKQHNEELSSITLRSIGDAVISTSRVGKVMTMNKVAEQLTGWTEVDAKGRMLNEVFRIINAETRLEVHNPVEDVLRSGKIVGLANHTVLISKQGPEFQIADSAAPILNEDGTIEGVVLVFRDVTKEYEVAAALQESNERYKAVFTWAPIGILHFDNNGVIYDVNEEFIRIVGSSRASLIGLNMRERIVDKEIIAGVNSSLLGISTYYEGVYQSVTADKKTPVRGNFVAIRNGEGEIMGGIGLFEDVSEKVAFERELQFKNSAFEASLTANSIATPDGLLFSVNQAFVDVFGYTSSDEVLGKHISDFFLETDNYHRVQEALLKTGKWSGEFSVRRSDGKTVVLQGTATALFDDSQALIGYQSSLIDITATKNAQSSLMESESKFRSIAENSSDMICLLDQNGLFLYCNKSYERILGYSPSDLVGKSCFELVHPDEKEEIEELFRIETVDVTHSFNQFKIRLLAADGSVRWVEHRLGHPVVKDQVKINVLTASDVTEQILAARKLDQTKTSFADIFNNVSEAVYIQDEEGVFLDVNRGAELMYGMSRMELVGQSPVKVSAPGLNDMELVRQLSVKVFQSGIAERFEFWGLRSNGEVFPKEVILNKGQYFGRDVLIATARDISKQKHAEELLKKAVSRSEALLGANPDMMFVFSKEGFIVDFHAERDGELLIPPDQFLNRKVDDVLPPMLVELTYRMIEAVLRTGELQAAEYNLLRNEQLNYYESRYVPCGEDEVLAIVREITTQKNNEIKLKESEERYRALADNAFQGILVLSLQGEILSVNPAMVKILEGESEADIVGRFATDFILPDSLELVMLDLANVAQRVDSYVSQYHCKSLKNNFLWIESIGKVVDYKDGLANVVSIRDITQKKKAEEALRKRDVLLQAAAKVGKLLLSSIDVRIGMQQAIDLIGKATGHDRVSYYKVSGSFSEDDLTAVMIYEWVATDVKPKIDHEDISNISLQQISHEAVNCLLNEKCFSDFKSSPDDPFAPVLQKHAIQNFLMVPVIGQDSLLVGILCFDNSEVDYSWNNSETDAFATVASIIGSYLQRMAHEIALSESETKYRLLAENTDDVIWMMDMEGKYHFISPSVEKLLGYSPAEITAGKYNQWLTPESAELVAVLLRKAIEKLVHGEELTIEVFRVEQVRKDASTVWTEVNVSAVFDETGGFKYFLGVTRDITQQIDREAVLANSRQQKEALLRAIPDQLIVFNHRGMVMEVYNTPQSDEPIVNWENQPLNEIFPPDVVALFMRSVLDSDTDGHLHEFSFSLSKPTGNKYYTAKVIPLLNRYLAIIRDVTREYLAVDQLRESENKNKKLQELFRNVADNMPDMIWAKDLENKYIFVNKSVCSNLLNTNDLDEPIGKTDLFFASREKELHPDVADWHTFDRSCQNSDSIVIQTRQPGHFVESGNVRGRFLSLDVVKAPLFNEQGEIVGTAGAARDITSRVREEKIRKVQFEIARAVIETNTLKDFIEVVQSKLSKLVDTTNFYIAFYDEVTGMCSSPYFSDELDDVSEWPAERSATGRVILSGEAKLLHRSDFEELIGSGQIDLIGVMSECWLGVPLRSGSQTAGAFVVQSYVDAHAYTVQDMEVLQFMAEIISLAVLKFKNDELLREALERAQQSDKLKSAFMANMSHEIRTPLNGILGFSGLMTDDLITMDEVKKYSGIITKSGTRLLELINNIIDISRIEAGITLIEPTAVSPADAVSDVVNQFIVHATRKNLELRKVCPTNSNGLIFQTDSLRLHQILSNLVSNAIKFTSLGFVELGFYCTDNYIHFFVKDSGIGIPENELTHIFERFYQVDNSYSRGHEGVGLGLSLCKSLAELLGGRLTVASKEQEGTTFTLVLPLNKMDEGKKAFSDFQNPEIPLPEVFSPKILVVEDDPINVEYMKAALSHPGFDVHFAVDYDETLHWLELNKGNLPHLIFMDIKLPGKSGFQLTEQIKKLYAGIPVVALTAFTSEVDKDKAFKAGCSRFVSKPVNKKELYKILNEMLN